MAEKSFNFEALVAVLPTYPLATRQYIDGAARRLLTLLGGDGGGTTPPPVPLNFIAVGGAGICDTSWDASVGAIQYKVYRFDATLPPDPVEVATTGNTSFQDTVAAGEYTYYVTALNFDLLESAASNTSTTTVTAPPAGDPTTPTGLNLSVTPGVVQVDLSWDALAAGTVSVRIQRSLGAGSNNFEDVASGVTGTSYTDSGVSPRLTYRYRLYGVAADGDESSATAIQDINTPSTDSTPPPVPILVNAEAGDGSAVLTWQSGGDPSGDFLTYQFGVSIVSGDYEPANGITRPTGDLQNPIVDPTVLLTNPTVQLALANGTLYYLAVRSVDTSYNVSAWSPEVTVTPAVGGSDSDPPATPAGQSAGTIPATGTGIRVSWLANSEPDLLQYKIYYDDQGSFSSVFVGKTEVFYNFPSFTADYLYRFQVTAIDDSGNESNRTAPVTYNPTTGFLSGPSTPPPGPFVPLTGDSGGNSSTAGITAQYTAGSTVHQYFENSFEQNADLFVPSMRSARASRSTTIDTTQASVPQASVVDFTNTRWLNAGWQWDNYLEPSSPLDVWTRIPKIINCRFGERTVAGAVSDYYWCNRRYNMPGEVTLNTDVADGPTIAAFSCAMNGSGIFAGNTGENLSGSFMSRPKRIYSRGTEGPHNLESTRASLHLAQNNHVVNVGSYAFDYQDWGSPSFPSTVIWRNNSVVSSGGAFRFTQFDYTSALAELVVGNPNTAPKAVWNVGAMAHPCALLVLDNSLIDLDATEDPMITIDGVDEVILEDLLLICREGTAVVEFNAGRLNPGTKPCGTIDLRNIKVLGDVVFQVVTSSGARVTLDGNTESYQRIYNGDTGALISEGSFTSSTSGHDPATDINSVDPFDTLDLDGYTVPWGITGVTV